MPAFRVLAAAAVVAATIPLARAGEVSLRQPPGELSEIKQLPNPFVFLDGSVVRSKEDWNRRRIELKSLFEKYEYGHLPPKPEKMTVTAGQVRVDEGARVARQELAVTLEHAGKTLVLHISLGLPLKPAGPVPVVVEGEFARPDPGRPGKPPALTLGGSPVEWLRILTDRGYGVAEFNFQEAAFDNGARSAGVYHLYGNGIDCGALMAWAWGIHRVIDAIEGDARIDSKKIVVTGHKRYGKTALLAGAFDERIALTVPSHSGCAGRPRIASSTGRMNRSRTSSPSRGTGSSRNLASSSAKSIDCRSINTSCRRWSLHELWWPRKEPTTCGRTRGVRS